MKSSVWNGKVEDTGLFFLWKKLNKVTNETEHDQQQLENVIIEIEDGVVVDDINWENLTVEMEDSAQRISGVETETAIKEKEDDTKKINNKNIKKLWESGKYGGTSSHSQNEEVIKSFVICEDHFKDTDFVNKTSISLNRNAISLSINPPQLLPSDDPPLLNNEITSSSHSQNKEVICYTQDHDYCAKDDEVINLDNFDFLNEDGKGILAKISTSRKDLTPRKSLMYRVHRNICSKLSTLGRSNKPANHALVFMVKCIRKQWKQVVAYYFTANTTVAHDLKFLIKELMEIGLAVVGTSVFNFDQQKTFKSLPKLKKEHFNFTDSYVKMKVKVAAAQLSSSVAGAIETFATFASIFPSESIFTAEFVDKIDRLFDFLNGSQIKPSESKPFRCALSASSPHLKFWSKLLTELAQWKLYDLNTGIDCTNRFSFVRGWQITIKVIMFLWSSLKEIDGFNYLNLRGLNQDSLENLFCSVRFHGVANTDPSCHQFTAALKTVLINKLALPPGSNGNCEEDTCSSLNDLCSLLKYVCF
ncbi:hypothetical protein ILUMI_18376 [Ignelater luminosus]|uniref:THAP-type domain-containing protein n=1 Tax=Ignelater luminosus TaxID=2038154 RepID=A0A8K0CPA6_IGNLU|nr:hypothetical protein ILUMI_18376 [Ignelater luminosus]